MGKISLFSMLFPLINRESGSIHRASSFFVSNIPFQSMWTAHPCLKYCIYIIDSNKRAHEKCIE
jgi:hypothetical protein